MKLDRLVGDRFKERPAECSIDSHALMVRGGYMKFMAGIGTLQRHCQRAAPFQGSQRHAYGTRHDP